MHLTRRKIRAFSAVAALAGAIGLGTAHAPGAMASAADCPDKKFCLWEHAAYQGAIAYSSNPQPDLHGFNDKATSFWNRTDGWITVYDETNYRKVCWEIPPGGYSAQGGRDYIPDAWVNTAFNDMASSFKPGRCVEDGVMLRWTFA
ncbi:peptidase inhibitor family I36 protein [Streptomyces fumanus]|uniref:Peptidase inhibitor family I36 n=1 Tax=Streptomyces fumanus TaxID=67302 RepID=A0A919EBS0_9ACTN|nr:peptidase inhibitor family I36 protein [Streptomyces fumanus]GHF34345.1 hypothetical protein GCM10018772_69990 [Streptomyces fumanus]